MWRRFGAPVALGLMCMADAGAAHAGWFGSSYPAVGKTAPTFTAVMPDGQELTLDDYKGQVLIINFWATWCGPCKQELPLLDAFYKQRRDYGLRVIAVTTENSLPMYKLAPLQKLLAVPLMGFMRGDYAPINGAVPTNYVIDRAGVVRYAQEGAFDLETLNKVVIPLLAATAPSASPATLSTTAAVATALPTGAAPTKP